MRWTQCRWQRRRKRTPLCRSSQEVPKARSSQSQSLKERIVLELFELDQELFGPELTSNNLVQEAFDWRVFCLVDGELNVVDELVSELVGHEEEIEQLERPTIVDNLLSAKSRLKDVSEKSWRQSHGQGQGQGSKPRSRSTYFQE